MSSIDDRVVNMKFNNSQFEAGVKTTSDSIDGLKKKLDFKGAVHSLGELDAAGKRFDLSGLSRGVEVIGEKFKAMSVVGIAALATLATKATSVGLEMAKSMFVDPAKSGLAEYETNLNSIQTILSNTSAKGTTLDDVNASLAELNEYSDKTIYNFSQMARNIGTFTAAGVELKPATAAIKGIANLAAVSGSSAEQASTAMYQLSQAMASGTVKLMDWNSVVNAGMGGEVFQNSLKETARAHGVAVDDLIAKNGSFRDSLQEGWLSTEILSETLSKFTGDLSREQLQQMGYTEQQIDGIIAMGQTAIDAATKIKTFSQLMNTIAETSASGWAQSWQIVLGDFDEAKTLFTEINDTIGAMQKASAKARNDMLTEWKDEGGRTAAIDAIRNAFNALMKIMTPIKEAWREVFPATTGKELADITKAIRDFTAGLIISDEAAATLKTVAKGLFSVLKFGFDAVGVALTVVGFVVKTVFDILGALGGVVAPLVKFFGELAGSSSESAEKIDYLGNALEWLRTYAIEPVIGAIVWLGDTMDDLLSGKGAKVADAVKGFFKPLLDIGDQVKSNWKGLGAFMEGAWNFIKPLVDGIANVVTNLRNGIKDAMKGVDINTILAAVNTGFVAMIALTIKKYLDNVGSVFESFSGMMEGVTGVLKGMQQDLQATALIKIAIAIGLLALALIALTTVDPAKIGPAVGAMAAMVTALVAALVALDKFSNDTTDAPKLIMMAAALVILSIAVNILASALVKMAALSWEELVKGLIGLGGALAGLLIAVKVLKGSEGDLIKAGAALLLLSTGVLVLAGALSIFANMSWEQLGKAGAALAVILVLLVGSLMILQTKSAGVMVAAQAIFIISAALGVLTASLAILGLLPMPVLVQGLLALGIMLALLVIAVNALAVNIPGLLAASVAMLAMAFAVNVLVGAVVILGTIPMAVLIQGLIALAATMLILVGAMYLMVGALPGAAATIVVAGAVFILAMAIGTLGAMDLGTLVQGLIALVAVFLVLGAAGLLLGPLTPILLGLGAALLLMGVGILAMSVAMVIFSGGLLLFGPAAMVAAGGLQVLAAAVMNASAAIPAFLGLGVGLLAFGVGAAVAAVGVAALGLGLMALGVGLALVGAIGLIGVTALGAVVMGMMKLLPETLNMLALGAAFGVLGAALVVLGAGALLAGTGLMLVGAGLLLIGAGSAIASVAMNSLGKAVERLADKAEFMTIVANAITKLGNSASKAATGASATASALDRLSASAEQVAKKTTYATDTITESFPLISASATMTATQVNLQTIKMATSMTTFATSIPNATRTAVSNISAMGSSINAGLINVASGAGGSAEQIGIYINQGMARGLYNGSYIVNNAARQVALNALAASKKALGVASPSKEYEKIGMWNDKGLAKGMVRHVGTVENASMHVADKSMMAFRKKMVMSARALQLKKLEQPTIKPVLDLTGVKEDAKGIDAAINSGKNEATITADVAYVNASSISTQRRAQAATEQQTEEEKLANVQQKAGVTFIQHNTSPKALPPAEIYRRTKNQLSVARGALTPNGNES